jgi:DNA-binding NarL/FixJ family response regulator
VLTELVASYAKQGDADAKQWALTEIENTRASGTSDTVEYEAESSAVRLSRAEQRVVDLVLKGHSNAHIALKLFLSKRTIDTHLGRIYKKLGISSRTQLATILGDSASAS